MDIKDTFMIYQYSKIYFSKLENQEIHDNSQSDQENIDYECAICYSEKSCIIFDKCFHGGICKTCIVNFIKSNLQSCPYCKETSNKYYVYNDTEQTKVKCVVGKIEFE